MKKSTPDTEVTPTDSPKEQKEDRFSLAKFETLAAKSSIESKLLEISEKKIDDFQEYSSEDEEEEQEEESEKEIEEDNAPYDIEFVLPKFLQKGTGVNFLLSISVRNLTTCLYSLYL